MTGRTDAMSHRISDDAPLPEGLDAVEWRCWSKSRCNNRNHGGLMLLLRQIIKEEPVWPSRTAQDVAIIAMEIDRRMVYRGGCGQPDHVTGGREGEGTSRWCETCRRIDAEQRLAEAQALCREAGEMMLRLPCSQCSGIDHENCDLCERLRAMGGE